MFDVVTNVSYTHNDVEDHVIALAKFGSLRGFVDPSSVNRKCELPSSTFT